ncbi:MAG: adenylate/guanylate cyclase domain-containing protein [Anaerolineales bacterium]|nr:adenylate/guanylate cyclase domain-containing protein [Anaerolineales bacterium]
MAGENFKRKLAAIFYADVAGYSRLTGTDEEGTHRRLSSSLDRMADLIKEHRGRVVHHAGDAVLADFPMVSPAINCAVAFQSELAEANSNFPEAQKLQFRVGVNLGEVIVDRDDIYGESVNIAARLEALADPGGICVSEAVRAALGEQAPFAFEYLGEQQVKNIAIPVKAYRVVLGESRRASGVFSASEGRPSLAVMPFMNLSGDPDQEYVVDGITEEIITALSRVRWFFVIARQSAFVYKDRPVDLREVAAELEVQYIVEGSVRISGPRIRVAAQLADGHTGKQIWAKRYDRENEDLFDLQDEIAETVVGAIEPELGRVERDLARVKRPENLQAWDYYQRGMWQLYRYTDRSFEQAIQLLEKAVDLDPGMAAAHSGIAEACYFRLVYGYSESPENDRSLAFRAAQRGVELDPEDAAAHSTLGRVYYLRREHARAIPELETALELNPSLAWGHYGLGAAMVFSGRAPEAVRNLETAIRLSPRDPNRGSFLVRMADAYLFMKNYEEAVHWAHKSLLQPNFQWSRYAVLLSALGHLGKTVDAEAVLADLLQKRPDFSVDFVRRTHLFANESDMEHYIDGLIKAGVF